jgi:hypothetical protein
MDVKQPALVRVFLCPSTATPKIHRHFIATQKAKNKKATLSSGLTI